MAEYSQAVGLRDGGALTFVFRNNREFHAELNKRQLHNEDLLPRR
jgi:hypothetical protein